MGEGVLKIADDLSPGGYIGGNGEGGLPLDAQRKKQFRQIDKMGVCQGIVRIMLPYINTRGGGGPG